MDADTTSDIPNAASIEVSVVIVNWNTCDLLRDCLQSIVDQTSANCEMIVVDNASADASAQMVRDEFPQAVLIANTENNGFAAANNQGLAVARGEHVLLLNPDTIILDSAIDKMMEWLARHPDVGCVGCQVMEGPDVIQRTCFAEPGLLNLFIVDFGLMRLGGVIALFARPWYTNWDRKSERDVDVVSGMFMLVPRHVLEKVGPLDDAFFVYSEEADWCYRIRQAGWRCVFSPEAQIIHLDGGSKSTSQIRSRMYVQMQKSHLIYSRKHHGQVGYLGTKLIYILSATLRLALFGAMRLVRKDAETKAKVRLSLASLQYLIFGKEPMS